MTQMQGKEVMISIKSVQKYEGSFPDFVELITTGIYNYQENDIIISYVDTESDSDGRPTNTNINIRDGKVHLAREGVICSQMLFENNKRNFSLYQTEFGSFMLGVKVHRIRVDLDEKGGELELVYAIELDHSTVGENRFHLTVKEVNPGTSYNIGSK